MKAKISNRRFSSLSVSSRRGFTLVEVLVGSLIMLTIVVATLALYTKSNAVSVDQQGFAELQHDVRAAMYFISRDIKSAGAGLPQQLAGYFVQAENNDSKGGPLTYPDRLTILGNADPLRLFIQSFAPGSNIITVEPNQFEIYPYNTNAYPDDPVGFINRLIIVLPNPELNKRKGEVGRMTAVDFIANTITFERVDPANAKLPNGLTVGGDPADYIGGTVHFIEFRTYWLDVDGNYPGCITGTDGYLGVPGVLYVSQWNPLVNGYEHLALAQNIEDLQFQFHGDINDDQQLDDNNSDGTVDVNDFQNWVDLPFPVEDDEEEVVSKEFTSKSLVVAGIRSVRILILGKTANPYASFTGAPPDEVIKLYGKPAIADSPEQTQPDKHRRFLLESTAQIRNMSLGVYNSGTM
ncbi:MAG: prepilin-type N-terminal cleavage/methylation domain-containing protein [Candidatus Aminicenantes bacterium]|nr:prepilin-type N-terminal cleavage/methylation domain-containing protein [Candidatus Aminicenantes bacterium]